MASLLGAIPSSGQSIHPNRGYNTKNRPRPRKFCHTHAIYHADVRRRNRNEFGNGFTESFGELDFVRKHLGEKAVASKEVLGAFTALSARSDLSPANFQLSPRKARQAARPRNERGLPRWKELKALASTYLKTQLRLWPELAESGLLPEFSKDNVRKLARQFRKRFINKRVVVFAHALVKVPWIAIASSYVRYSDSGSNPRSLDQQLKIQLKRARDDEHFIPWVYVFADAGVTATTAHRCGYQLAKKVLNRDPNMLVMYIDELGRASRDTVETMYLGQTVGKLKKRLLGVSDNFDSDSPAAKMQLMIFACMQEWFIDQLRSKVNRGMNDAFDQGTNLGVVPLGYKLIEFADHAGKPVAGKDGKTKKILCIDQMTSQWVLAAFFLYAIEMKSRDEIATMFNNQSVGGRQTWNSAQLRKLLTRHKYVGIMTYRMTYKEMIERGKKKGTVVIRSRPRKEWMAQKARHLQIVPRALWKAAQSRLAKSGAAFAKKREGRPARTELYDDNLIRPYCGACGKPLIKGASGPSPSWVCGNGRTGRLGCTLKSYKTAKIVDDCVLDYVKQHVFTLERFKATVVAANRYVAEESSLQRGGNQVQALESAAAQIRKKLDRLLAVIEGGGSPNSSGTSSTIGKRVADHEQQLRELNRQIAQRKQRAAVPAAMTEITEADAEKMLSDLRGLLNQDAKTVAPILRALTGQIRVEESTEPGRKKPIWVAKFTVNLVPVLLQITKAKKTPTTDASEYPHTGDWKNPEMLSEGVKQADFWVFLASRGWHAGGGDQVKIKRWAKYELLSMSPRFQGLLAEGKNAHHISLRMNCSYDLAQATVNFLQRGMRPVAKPPGKRRPKDAPKQQPAYIKYAHEVRRMKDIERHPFTKIATALKITPGTASRAYWYKHPDAADNPPSKSFSLIGIEKLENIRKMLQHGEKVSAIARLSGVGQSTVRRIWDELNLLAKKAV